MTNWKIRQFLIVGMKLRSWRACLVRPPAFHHATYPLSMVEGIHINTEIDGSELILNSLYFSNNSTTLNSAKNEIFYNIVTATVWGDRGERLIVFPSLTSQNPEEGGHKPPKCRFFNTNYSYNYLSFLNWNWTASSIFPKNYFNLCKYYSQTFPWVKRHPL